MRTLSTHPNTGAEQSWNLGVTEAQQADYLRRTYDLTAARWPQVDHMFWYNSRDKVSGSGSAEVNAQQNGYGLLRRDYTAKPAMGTLKQINTGRYRGPELLIPTEAVWSYDDTGVEKAGWRTSAFDASSMSDRVLLSSV